jgi:hypothetical protein
VAAFSVLSESVKSANRHGAGVGPNCTKSQPRPRLIRAPFGMDTQRSAPRHCIALDGTRYASLSRECFAV